MERDEIIKAWEDEVAVGKEVGLTRDFLNYVSISLVNATLSLIKELTEENERLRAKYEITYETPFGKQTMPNLLRLEGDAANLYERIENETKADTVRKMQKRINAHFDSDSDYFRSSHGYIRDVVDQIAKEMLEGE